MNRRRLATNPRPPATTCRTRWINGGRFATTCHICRAKRRTWSTKRRTLTIKRRAFATRSLGTPGSKKSLEVDDASSGHTTVSMRRYDA